MELLAVVLYNRYFTGSVLNYNLKSTIPFISAANYETVYEIFNVVFFLSTKEKKMQIIIKQGKKKSIQLRFD